MRLENELVFKMRVRLCPANKKGGTDRPRLFDALTDGSDYFDVLSLGAFLALRDFELHFLAFDQGFETRA